MADTKKILNRKPKIQPQPGRILPKRGVSDKVKLVLHECGDGECKPVPEDVIRKPGKTYIYKQEAI